MKMVLTTSNLVDVYVKDSIGVCDWPKRGSCFLVLRMTMVWTIQCVMQYGCLLQVLCVVNVC